MCQSLPALPGVDVSQFMSQYVQPETATGILSNKPELKGLILNLAFSPDWQITKVPANMPYGRQSVVKQLAIQSDISLSHAGV